MTSQDVRLHISTNRLAAVLIPDTGKGPRDPDVIKSLIIMLDGAPAVAVLRGCDRMDHRKV
jgi:hypothetical protein